MALALVYIFATAKPVSIRRLVALFTSTFILTKPFLEIFQMRNAQEGALLTASSLTLLFWSLPLLQMLCAIPYHRTWLEIQNVSARVQWTYLFVMLTVPILGTSAIVRGTRPLHLGELVRLLAIIGIATTTLQVGFCTCSSRTNRHGYLARWSNRCRETTRWAAIRHFQQSERLLWRRKPSNLP